LLKRLSQRLELLTGGARNLPARQQTLRNTISWSYDLLSQQEQRLFRWLSIFVGGCTLQAVEAICNTSGNVQIPILDEVASLLDKNLLQQTEREAENPRFMMLETIREYGLACLRERGELEAAQQAHAGHYLAFVEKAEPGLRGAMQAVWLEQLEREFDNLRAAQRWFIEQHQTEMALRMGGAQWWFWMVRGHVSEGWTFLERVLSTNEPVKASVRGKALYAAGVMALNQRDYERAEAHYTESLLLHRQIGDKALIAISLYSLGRVV
jgi:predicted ATPase